ncbi:hypothetical protein AAOE16_03075 [Ekhidna sp. MALMAid0563]|uniref:hypothetical protein n=1 Tax=Ekhidna sp. MALMAid0563 TaxID=3143937 RepID=UPI0032DED716
MEDLTKVKYLVLFQYISASYLKGYTPQNSKSKRFVFERGSVEVDAESKEQACSMVFGDLSRYLYNIKYIKAYRL